MSDNTTVVRYIKKMGRTRSMDLCQLSWDILRLCQDNHIHLMIRHIPGARNIIADRLSRPNKVIQTEWSLDKSLFRRINLMLGPLRVDMFATRENCQLPEFFSPVPDNLAIEGGICLSADTNSIKSPSED